MYLISKYQRQISGALATESRRSYALAWGVLLGLVALLAASLCRVGAISINGNPSDVLILFDTAWRMQCGEIPHQDFFSHLGVLPAALVLLGAKFGHMSISAFTNGNMALMAVVAVAGMAALCRRTSALTAFIFTVYISLLAVTPRPLGNPPDCIDYAMMYNRYGESFLSLIALILFVPLKRPGPAWADVLEGVLAGALLTALWFTKVSYVVMGVGFLGVAAAFGYCRLRVAASCACGALLSLAAVHHLSGIPFGAMLGDYRIVAAGQNIDMRFSHMAHQFFKQGLLLPVLFFITWERFSGGRARGIGRAELFRAWIFPVIIYGGAFLLLAANSQVEEMPLLAIAALYGVELTRRDTVKSGSDPFLAATRHAGCLCFLLLYLLPTLGPDLKATRNVLFSFVKQSISPESLQTTCLSDLHYVKIGSMQLYSEQYIDNLNDGVQLLRRHADPGMRLCAALYADPFHLALGMRPARGGIVCVTGNIMNAKSHPDIKRVLGDATHLMIERGWTYHDMLGPEWDSLQLETVDVSKYFVLLKILQTPAGKSE